MSSVAYLFHCRAQPNLHLSAIHYPLHAILREQPTGPLTNAISTIDGKEIIRKRGRIGAIILAGILYHTGSGRIPGYDGPRGLAALGIHWPPLAARRLPAPIEFQCDCGRTFKLPRHLGGRPGRCPQCRRCIFIPKRQMLSKGLSIAMPIVTGKLLFLPA